MSETYFSKQDSTEKLNRLSSLGLSKGEVIVWKKGSKDKHKFRVLSFDKNLSQIVLDSKAKTFKEGETLLCSFELRGMNFFSEVIFLVSISEYAVLHFSHTLFKSERRSSFRLMTYPVYEVFVDFKIPPASYEGSNVVSLSTGTTQTGLFKSFLKLIDDETKVTGATHEASERLSIRVQDLSTTGMAIHVGELEARAFNKDQVYHDVNIRFSDETIKIPEVKVVYVVAYISNDKNLKKYKVGITFPNLSATLDEVIGKKINKLLRDNDFNKDFENFLK